MIQLFLNSQTVEARVMLRLLGLMASCIDLVPWAQLHMRPLQLYLLAWWKPALHSLNHLIPLYQSLQEHLFWWLNRRNFFKGVLLEQESAQVTLVTDASQSGWGAHINNYQIAARNTSNRSVCDFNEQEAASVLLSLTGRNSSVNRCTVDEMDRSICLCLPSTDNSKQSITKNTERGLCNFTDSSNVAETVMVQSTSQPVNRLSNTTACPTKSIKSKWNSSSKSKCSKSCSLESVKRSYTAKGFSPKIASIISKCTKTVYTDSL
ncbi:unnamed protein product [Mytilus coruscus]|uniref:Uncharacterized protein n=1 Tax=Mytilus coruscus TaxID=42192 RepID=A0A6J8AEB1_MYTCO|nr:unnamed protein product [Mytilus coruscus]